jgi:hypothetical protein
MDILISTTFSCQQFNNTWPANMMRPPALLGYGFFITLFP